MHAAKSAKIDFHINLMSRSFRIYECRGIVAHQPTHTTVSYICIVDSETKWAHSATYALTHGSEVPTIFPTNGNECMHKKKKRKKIKSAEGFCEIRHRVAVLHILLFFCVQQVSIDLWMEIFAQVQEFARQFNIVDGCSWLNIQHRNLFNIHSVRVGAEKLRWKSIDAVHNRRWKSIDKRVIRWRVHLWPNEWPVRNPIKSTAFRVLTNNCHLLVK